MNIFLNRNKIKLVLVDWFGVLSTNYYWCVQSKKNQELKEWCDCVFHDSDILNDWMRGKLSLEYLSQFKVPIDTKTVVNLFLRDLEYYKPDHILLESLNKLFPNAKKVLVTDNFPLFSYILDRYDQINSYFDKLYLSHEIGVLKNDNPSLFDFILNDLALDNFENCLLIDDNEVNCKNFRAKAGRTVYVS